MADRQPRASEVQILHWDGKILEDSDGVTQDRLAVMLSGDTPECRQGKILGVHGLDSGTAKNQTEECLRLIKEWDIASKIIGTCWDTTATNTGKIQGSAIAIEEALNKKLLYFACHHHFHEVIVKAVWEAVFGKDEGPVYTDFKIL